jgi:hypothetical protein
MGSECCTNQSPAATNKEVINSGLSKTLKEDSAGHARPHRRDLAQNPRESSHAHQMHSLQPHAQADKGRGDIQKPIAGLDSAPLGGAAVGIVMKPLHKSESEQPQTSHVHHVLEFSTHAADMRAPKCKGQEKVPEKVSEKEGKQERPESRREKSAFAREAREDGERVPLLKVGSVEEDKEGQLLPRSRPRRDTEMPLERIQETLSFRKEDPSLHMLTGGLWPQMTSINFKVEAEHCKRECTDFLEEKYVILNYVDCGAFGEVKKIREYATGAFRALKIINKNRCQRTNSSNDEISILKKLVRLEPEP